MSLRITKSEAIIVNYIQQNPFTDIELMESDLGIRRNILSRLLGSLEEKEVIIWERNTDQPLHGTHQSTPNIHGWIVKP